MFPHYTALSPSRLSPLEFQKVLVRDSRRKAAAGKKRVTHIPIHPPPLFLKVVSFGVVSHNILRFPPMHIHTEKQPGLPHRELHFPAQGNFPLEATCPLWKQPSIHTHFPTTILDRAALANQRLNWGLFSYIWDNVPGIHVPHPPRIPSFSHWCLGLEKQYCLLVSPCVSLHTGSPLAYGHSFKKKTPCELLPFLLKKMVCKFSKNMRRVRPQP